jgi:hypothetical protein
VMLTWPKNDIFPRSLRSCASLNGVDDDSEFAPSKNRTKTNVSHELNPHIASWSCLDGPGLERVKVRVLLKDKQRNSTTLGVGTQGWA